MSNLLNILKERGFIYQSTDEQELIDLFDRETVKAYVGFDPTADSLHVGSLIPIMALAWAQRSGHRPIVIVGGGTAMVGDPSGKTEARQMMTKELIDRNKEALKIQFSQYFSFGEEKALMIDNADWLMDLKYIDFLRDIGRHFSVNRMLAVESYKSRLDSGLTFLEFNYMLLQAYDFYMLFKDYDCVLQMGGQDQWGNILAGVDLIRRVEGKPAYALTFPLLMNPGGEKFGKTHSGNVWLSKDMTSCYDFYQFWRNSPDSEVEKYLGLFTFLPMEEVKRLGQLDDTLINRAKEILAFEATSITHGLEEAKAAYLASIGTFGTADPEGKVQTSSQIAQISHNLEAALPTTAIKVSSIEAGIPVIELFVKAGLAKSKGEARRLIRGGGASVNDNKVESEELLLTADELKDNAFVLRAGKKRYHRFLVQ